MDEKKNDTATPGTGTPTPATHAPRSAGWTKAIQPLVARLEMTEEAVTLAILNAKLVRHANDKGAESLTDADSVTEGDFQRAFPEAATGDLRKAVKEMRTAALPEVIQQQPAAPTAGAFPIPATATVGMGSYMIPEVLEGTNFLEALSASKDLTVDLVTIRAALEAKFADDIKLSEIPERIVELMEKHADTIEEPVGGTFLEVLKFVKQRKWAEVNVDSNLVTVERKKGFLKRLKALPAAVYEFHMALTAWYEELKVNRAASPLGMLNGTNFYPPADNVVAAAETIVRCLTSAFAGLGVMVAKAMAYEALKTREILQRSELPVLTGSANREIMLKNLGMTVSNVDIRIEKNVAKYVIFAATTVYRNLPAGQEGPVLESLYLLGQQILPWMTNRGTTSPDDDNGRRGNGRNNANGDDNRRPAGGYGAPHPVAIRDQGR